MTAESLHMAPPPAPGQQVPEAASRQQSLVRAIARHWWMPLFMLLIGLLAAWVWTARETAIFRASTLLVVIPDGDLGGGGEILRSLDALERRTLLATFARLPATSESRRAVADVLQRDPSALSEFRISAAVVPNTNLIRVDVDGPEPEFASRIANAAAARAADDVRSLYRVYTMRPIAAAQPPQRPVHPEPRRNYLVSSVLGLFLGAIAAVGIEHGRK